MANPKTILIEFLSFHHVLPGKIFSIGFSNQLFLTWVVFAGKTEKISDSEKLKFIHSPEFSKNFQKKFEEFEAKHGGNFAAW